MTAQATIVVASVKDVIAIPSAALGTKEKDGRYKVRVKVGGKLEDRLVGTGLNNRVARRGEGRSRGRRRGRDERGGGTARPGEEVVTALLDFRALDRSYQAGDQTVHALRGVSLTIEAGEMVAIMGVSGSGKSTLMNILGCLDRPTAGSYRVAGQETGSMPPDELARLRREHFGLHLPALPAARRPDRVAQCRDPGDLRRDVHDRPPRPRAPAARTPRARRPRHAPARRAVRAASSSASASPGRSSTAAR